MLYEVITKTQCCAHGPVDQGMFACDQRFADNGFKMLFNGIVFGNTAAEYDLFFRNILLEQGVGNVSGKPVAKSVTDLFEIITLLLGMDQIRLCKHRAPGGDIRPPAAVFKGQ